MHRFEELTAPESATWDCWHDLHNVLRRGLNLSGQLYRALNSPDPQVAAELRQGRAETPLQHFVLYGRGRGYLPHPKAVRAANPAAAASRFGGLWIDAGDAEAKIQGRQETGLLTDAQAERLRFFATNGYVILERAVEEPVLEAA